MTISPLALAAKKVIDAAWLNGDAYDLSSQAAFALESTQLLQSPETAAEHARLRSRVAELEGPARAHQRQGYEAAIEVMRSEKLPMSVGLLEAQLELDKLDGLTPAGLTVFRASHDSIVMGLYDTAAAAREHCVALMHREWPNSLLDWIEDEEDGVAQLVAETADGETETGYVVTALEVAFEYDKAAGE